MFAGSRQIRVHDEAKGFSFPVLVLYPMEAPSAPIATSSMSDCLGRFSIFWMKG